ncbi:SGNH/GDSL hydrolase family protein [Knoellia subterranea]|uniref:GDSL family lipase n=1 Tax=Knoellia subterranea KCTC 19937 TaxID=1385521 RepID=A0A0A0JP53_9MICO|nr:SGNH/GDSL hydrolase family protein [Knoellia subterranea]KGN37396.1 GDSL family lipase [Knoellia subterranea KCTC 19937]
MGRARRARKIAATAAYGGGGLAAASAALGAVGYGVIKGEALLARRIVGTPFDSSPDDNGTYGAGPGEAIEILVLGDSSAAGMGAHHAHETVGAIVANGVSALMGRRVHLSNHAVVGAESSDLQRQLAEALETIDVPDVVLIMVGANDVTHRIDRATAVRHLELTVRRCRALGSEVVVGTCPDLGTVEPLAQPLRLLARRWSRDLAAAQTIAVVEAGGRTVSLGDLLGKEFAASPKTMFSEDRFHPSAAGYARAAAALLPSVCAALGVWGQDTADRAPEARRGEGVGPVAVAAGQAVKDAGTEVSPTEVGGQDRGPRGRWAVLLRRRHDAVPAARNPAALPDDGTASATDHGRPESWSAATHGADRSSGEGSAQVGEAVGEVGDTR